MPESSQIYSGTELDAALRQGEILTGLQQVVADADRLGEPGDLIVDIISHPFAIVVSQDCDLDSDYLARGGSGDRPQTKFMAGVLLCEVEEASVVKGKIPGSDLWKLIRRNQNERYHFLLGVDAGQDVIGESLPDLVVDFKRYFTIPPQELYRRLNLGLQRRTRLVNPFLAHFAHRFAQFQSRVALPE